MGCGALSVRYSLLDYMVEPSHGSRFMVKEVAAISKCDATGWHRCVNWCGRYGCAAESVPDATCRKCLGEELIEGTLQSDNGTAYPVVRGIPRFLEDCYLVLVPGMTEDWVRRYRGDLRPAVTGFDQMQLQTAKDFGEEWRYFSQNLAEYEEWARAYFDLLEPETPSEVVLDAGCGMGRWAYTVGRRARTLLAVDLSSSVDQAAQVLSGLPNTHVVQADLHQLPFPPATFDLIYSLGVLHHLPDPLRGLDRLVWHLKDGGRFLAYFYYALDNRLRHFHVLLGCVTLLRLVISRLPRRVARWICYVIAVTVYWPLIQFGNVVAALGFKQAARQVPLYEFYTGKSFRSLFNDSVDRFATRVEFRFTREQIREMFSKVGVVNPRFSDITPFWKVLGIKAGASVMPQTAEKSGS